MKAAKRNVIHEAEASWKLKARPTDWRRWNIWGSAPLWPVCNMHAPWVSQIYDVIVVRHQTLCSPHSAIHITCLAYISQSISQAKQTFIVPYVARESDARHYAQRPPTTNVITCHNCLPSIQSSLIIGYGNSKISHEIIRVSHPC